MTLLFLYIPEYLKLSEIAIILGLKGNRSAKKWLSDNGIPISTVGNHNVVDRFIFEFKRQQIFVEQLRKSYPTNWFEIYDANTTDKGMVKAIRELYPLVSSIKRSKGTTIKKYIR